MTDPLEEKDRLRNSLRVLYAAYRTALLNRKYYGHRLHKTRRLQTTLDIFVAMTASSAIGAWVLWRNGAGQILWAVITGLAAIVAVIKPFLHLPKEIERLTCLYTGHAAAFHDLQRLVERVATARDYSAEVESAYVQISDRMRALCPQDDPSPNLDLIDRFSAEVNYQIPPSSLWWP